MDLDKIRGPRESSGFFIASYLPSLGQARPSQRWLHDDEPGAQEKTGTHHILQRAPQIDQCEKNLNPHDVLLKAGQESSAGGYLARNSKASSAWYLRPGYNARGTLEHGLLEN